MSARYITKQTTVTGGRGKSRTTLQQPLQVARSATNYGEIGEIDVVGEPAHISAAVFAAPDPPIQLQLPPPDGNVPFLGAAVPLRAADTRRGDDSDDVDITDTGAPRCSRRLTALQYA